MRSSEDPETVIAAYDDLDAAFERVASMSYGALTDRLRQCLLSRLEEHRRRQPSVEHLLINQIAAECSPEALGGTSVADVLATGLRISKSEARRRIDEATDLGRRTR